MNEPTELELMESGTDTQVKLLDKIEVKRTEGNAMAHRLKVVGDPFKGFAKGKND